MKNSFTLTDAGQLLQAVELMRSISMGCELHATMQLNLCFSPDGSVLFSLATLEGKAQPDEGEVPPNRFFESSYGNNAEFLHKLGKLAERLSEENHFNKHGKEPFLPGTDREAPDVAFVADGAAGG